MSLGVLISVILMVLKLTGYFDHSWLLVATPAIASAVIAIAIQVIVGARNR